MANGNDSPFANDDDRNEHNEHNAHGSKHFEAEVLRGLRHLVNVGHDIVTRLGDLNASSASLAESAAKIAAAFDYAGPTDLSAPIAAVAAIKTALDDAHQAADAALHPPTP